MKPKNGTLNIPYKLEDCEPGVQKELHLIVIPLTNDAESGFTADVDEVLDYEEHSEGEKEAKPYPAKGMDKSSPAVAIVISSGKKK